jgi:flagellar hook-length control protein FliK
VAALTSELVQVDSGVAKRVQHAGTVTASSQGQVVTPGDSTNSQKAAVAQTVSKNELTPGTVHPGQAQAAIVDGKTGADAAKKAVMAQEGKAGAVPEKEGVSVVAGKVSEGANEAAAARSKTVVPKETLTGAECSDAKAGSAKAAGVAQTSEAKVSAKPQPLAAETSPEKSVAKVGAESGTAAEMARKPEQNAETLRHEGRQTAFREATGVNPGKEAQVAAVASQGKDGLSSGLKEQADVSIAAGNGSTTYSQRLSAESPSTSTFDATSVRSASQSVSDQILDSVRASMANGDRQITIRLSPPELGSVTVRFQEQGEQVRAVLEVARSDTRQEVERAIPEVLRTLQEAGVQIKRVEVVLADQSGKDMGREQLQQDAWSQQQNSQQHGGTPRTPFAAGWETSGRTVQGSGEQEDANLQGLSATGGINMLA